MRLSGRYLTNQWTEFHETLVNDVVDGTDETTRFLRSNGQGQGHGSHTRRRLGVDVSTPKRRRITHARVVVFACIVFLHFPENKRAHLLLLYTVDSASDNDVEKQRNTMSRLSAVGGTIPLE